MRCDIADNDTIAEHTRRSDGRWSSTWCAEVTGTDTVVVHHATGVGDHYDAVATYVTTTEELAAREHDLGIDAAAVNPWSNGEAPEAWGCEVLAVTVDGGLTIALRDTSGTLGCDSATFDAARDAHLDGLTIDFGDREVR